MNINTTEENKKVECREDLCFLYEEKKAKTNTCMALKKSAWLDVFCPQGSCEINSPMQVP